MLRTMLRPPPAGLLNASRIADEFVAMEEPDPMLLDRIDIDSCGSLERIQLGPFSHRLNAVYGLRGAGTTATLEFVRNVMLGTDRQWHHGSAGSVVWGDPKGLPRQTIDAIVAATGQTPLTAILDACRAAGLETDSTPHQSATIARVRETIADLDRQLDTYRGITTARIELESSRLRLLDEMEEIERQERTPARADFRREELAARLSDARDEIARLTQQEEELRHLIAEIHRDLENTGELPRLEKNPHWRIAAAHRRELEELDNQLMRWRRTLREICAIRGSLGDLSEAGSPLEPVAGSDAPTTETRTDAADGRTRDSSTRTDNYTQAPHRHDGRPSAPHYLDPRFLNASYRKVDPHDDRDLDAQSGEPRYRDPLHRQAAHWAQHEAVTDSVPAGERSLQARLESVRRQIDLLVQRYEAPTLVPGAAPIERESLPFDPASVAPPALQILADSLRGMRDELRTCGHRLCDRQAMNSVETQCRELRHCQELLVRFIDRLIDVRNLLLRRIASEHDMPLAQLIDAFGDWRQCHDHPHLYQWLLSDKCPPRTDDATVHASRRKRLEQEQAELLEQLGRTVNWLDDRGNEVRLLQLRMRETPPVSPDPIDQRRREICRAELLRVEERLRWHDARARLQEQRQRHQRHLEELLHDSTRPSRLLAIASHWLARLGSPADVQLWTDRDGSLRVGDASSARPGDADPHSISLALRMAAAEELGRLGQSIPLLVEDPAAAWQREDSPARFAMVLAKFAERGHQLILFTEDRALADAVRSLGGRVQSLAAPQYIQMRYRNDLPLPGARDRLARDPMSEVNRKLDTLWREAYGLYDDPHWYQNPHRSRRSGVAGDQDQGSSDRAPRGPASPFFLTGNSPIDQAPSIDAVAADRLIQIGVGRVGRLLAADARSLAERLELPEVTAGVVRRWQDEAQLVCTVPQLRNFDARVLVGCGLSNPKQLAQMHPGHLLEKVETFLATERGRQILRSGTSYELSRITSWIAAANRSVARGLRHGQRELRTTERAVALHISSATTAEEEALGCRFHLRRQSSVTDAPSISPKAAGRLSRIGIRTVGDLLGADPAKIARRLRNRRIDESRVRRWQHQAELMCSVPELRSRPAALLVAVGVTSLEQLSDCDAAPLFRRIQKLVSSSAGPRILRGESAPTRSEIAGWVDWAHERRSRLAA